MCCWYCSNVKATNSQTCYVYTDMDDVEMDATSTLINMEQASSLVYGQLIGASDLGVLEHQITKRVGSTGLPQVVAEFYLFVRVAAVSTDSVEDIVIRSDAIVNISAFHATSTYLVDWIGGITATDSLIAFGRVNSISLQLPMRNTINIGLGDGSLLEMGECVMTGDPIFAGTCSL